MKPLFQDQTAFYTEIQKALIAKHKRIICQLPTGGGKTVVFSHIARNAQAKGRKTLVLVDRVELLKGFADEVPEAVVWNEDTKYARMSSIVVAMVETVARRELMKLLIPEFDVIIIDEAHMGNFKKMFAKIPQETVVLGFTATPNDKMTEYSEMVCGLQPKELIALGRLCRARTLVLGQGTDFSVLVKKGRDFSLESQAKAFVNVTKIENDAELILQNRVGKTIVFCVNAQHTKGVAEKLNAPYLLSDECTNKERTSIVRHFTNTPNAILVNCGMLTKGFNVRDIETVVLLFSTASLEKFLQCCGRGSRTFPGKKEFLIMDLGNNVARLGLWEDNRDWREIWRPKKKRQGIAPMKECKECGVIQPVQNKVCQHCGAMFPTSTIQGIGKAELIELAIERGEHAELSPAGANALKRYKNSRKKDGTMYNAGWFKHQGLNVKDLQIITKILGYKEKWAFTA